MMRALLACFHIGLGRNGGRVYYAPAAHMSIKINQGSSCQPIAIDVDERLAENQETHRPAV